MNELEATRSIPWWLWGLGLWIVAAAALLVWDNVRKKRAASAPPKPAKRKETRAEIAPAKRPALTPEQEEDERKPKAKRLLQGELPLPSGQQEQKLIRAMDGDKIKAEAAILHELQLVPYQTREEAAASALARTRQPNTTPRAA